MKHLTKRALRIEARKVRISIPILQRKMACNRSLQKLSGIFRKKTTVLFYSSFGSEFPTLSLIRQCCSYRSSVYIIPPNKKQLTRRMNCFSPVAVSSYGFARMGKRCSIKRVVYAFIPALMFDHKNNRLGQGGGYYDMYLRKAPYVNKLGIGFYCQLSQELLPVEQHDIPMDRVLLF
jgi:5-formyltetrahydrofolate cyclo-ligase